MSACRLLALTSSCVLAACTQNPPSEAESEPAGALTRARPVDASAVSSCAPETGPLELDLVSLTDAGELAYTCHEVRPPCKNASHPTVSADGRFVAFDSDAPDMVAGQGPRPGSTQIYVRDVARNRTILVSGRVVDGVVEYSDAGGSFPDISGDGRIVAFASGSTNLVASDESGHDDVFVCEIDTGRIERITANPDDTEFDSSSADPSCSYDGRFIAFASAATNMAPLFVAGGGDAIVAPSDGQTHLYLVDRTVRRFEWLDRKPDGTPGDASSSQPVISAGGEVIAFSSNATDLAGIDGNDGDLDIFVCMRETSLVELVSVAHGSGVGGNGVSRKPGVSGNGRFVVFEGTATDLLPPGVDTNNQSDVFVRDLQLGVTTRVSVRSNGGQANGTSGYGALSFEGRFVAFSSTARNLVPNDTTRGALDFFVHDRDVSGNGLYDEPGDICTRRMSVTPQGVQSNARSGGNCDLSADGRFVVFMSESNLLWPDDDNGLDDQLTCSPTCLFGRDVFRARIY